ncbi:MAG: arsenosugar biosynthesis radical SAM protein ArsS [Methylococcales bacterium]|nr:arsenosugar biosynthesis radical SAM protein ArsS [Methylococcales bacterium]
MYDTKPLLINHNFPDISRDSLAILQLNLGYLCNLSCTHCHVNASPKRTELMSKETIDLVFDFALKNNIHSFDLTGGAPEMNPEFRYLIERASAEGIKVIDRCNLVILEEDGYQDLAEFLARHKVEIIASLPCYLEDNVDKQRGKGTFNYSIKALKRLNTLGYAQPESDLHLNLVFNPQGASLPPPQQKLEQQYKQHLHAQFGIVFNHLFALTNLPIQRFGSVLMSHGEFEGYMQLLKNNYQAENLAGLMCRNTLSIDWQGFVYDCDFNQMLDLPLGENNNKTHLSQLKQDLKHHPINTLAHCYGCTAGQGSSCGGSLTN